jgi:hypothetical protein
VLLGSQTIGGQSGLSRATIGQMAVRIALQCSETDSQLILGDNNSAARLLNRPGEAIYNDAGGLVEGNSPFQIAWLPDEKREEYLNRVSTRAATEGNGHEPPIVFEGNAPADVAKNMKLARILDTAQWSADGSVPLVWLGEPVAIKDPTAVAFRRQSGANILIVGQQEEAALASMAHAIIALASQQKAVSFYVLDGTPADSPFAGTFDKLKAALPQSVNLVEFRIVNDAINEIWQEMQRRQADEQNAGTKPAIHLLVYGLQRYRALRRQEESFSFSSESGEAAAPKPDKQFAEILRDGPGLGIHVTAWADTLVSIERTLERGSMREFDNRVLFQMSAADSSNLIDSPMGNKLGFNRALAYSEERGTIEKFRPYALPDAAWLERVKTRLSARQ